MKTALITGGLGFIGSNIVKQLIEKKIVNKCIILDSYTGYVNPLKKITLILESYVFLILKKLS